MRLVNLSFLSILFVLVSFSNLLGQLKLDFQYRPRAEFRNGFREVMPKDGDPAFLVDHRARLKMSFKKKGVQLYCSLQDIRLWGNSGQVNVSDNNLAFHQMWVELSANAHWKFKIGRQEIVYDNQRLFGQSNWAQPARSHDALLIKFKKNVDIDFGFAFNQSESRLSGSFFSLPNYKTFQFVRLNKSWQEKADISLIAVNTGFQGIDESYFFRTYGLYGTWNFDHTVVKANAHLQEGRFNIGIQEYNAHQFSLELNNNSMDPIALTIGYEQLSGQKDLASNTTNFRPEFGANHRHNGLMDYFVIGPYARELGLRDLYVKIGLALKQRDFSVHYHYFGSSARDEHIMNELDFVIKHRFKNEAISLSAGYSQAFISDYLKSTLVPPIDVNGIQNWAWLMLDVNLELFKSKTKD